MDLFTVLSTFTAIAVLLIVLTGIVCYRLLNYVFKEIQYLEFIKSVIISDHEDICKFCEDNIIGGCSNTQFYQCEGRHCEDAEIMYFEDKEPAEIKEEYELKYKPKKL